MRHLGGAVEWRGQFHQYYFFAQCHWSELSPKLLLSMVWERASWNSAGPGNKSIKNSGLTGQVCSVTMFIYNIARPCIDQPGLDWQRQWSICGQTTSQVLMTALVCCVRAVWCHMSKHIAVCRSPKRAMKNWNPFPDTALESKKAGMGSSLFMKCICYISKC